MDCGEGPNSRNRNNNRGTVLINWSYILPLSTGPTASFSTQKCSANEAIFLIHSVAVFICTPAAHCTAYRTLLPSWAFQFASLLSLLSSSQTQKDFCLQSPLQNQTIITGILETGELNHRQITAKNLQCWPLILATTVAGCLYIQKETAHGHYWKVGCMWFAQHHIQSPW